MLYDKLKEYSQSGIYPFHMPGHKRIDITQDGIIPYNIDITEIDGFDNLHNAEGLIKAVQEKAKNLYSAKYAFILVNGATCGILSAIRSMTNYGDTILMARNCHKSVYNAVEICGLNAKYIVPVFENEFGIFGSLNPKSIENALDNDKDITLVVLTSPTYEGTVSDIKQISEICRKHGVKLFVDEAHGAHFPFSDIFPDEAMALGADAAVLSLHKTLPSLTQTALLLTNDKNISDSISENLSVFQTSSPSYILMSSIENCLDFLKNNKRSVDEYIKNLTLFLNSCKQLKSLKIVCRDNISAFDFDKSKIVISTINTDINGKQLSDILRNEYKIETEMAYINYVIAMTSVCDTKDGFERLRKALFIIDSHIKSDKTNKIIAYYPLPQKVFQSCEKHKHTAFITALESSVGKISLEYVWAYPPGIPLIVPGEIITREITNYIMLLHNNNIEINSSNKNDFGYLTVTEN